VLFLPPIKKLVGKILFRNNVVLFECGLDYRKLVKLLDKLSLRLLHDGSI